MNEQSRALIPQHTGSHAPVTDVFKLGDTLAKSGYFKDTRDAAQAVVKVLYGQELGIGPIQAMLGISIIEGKPAPNAGLIGALIKRSGRYTYRVEQHDEKACVLEFYENGKAVGRSSFSREDATAAGLSGKAVWKAYFRNMAFARALTNGARWYCPDVFGGAVYVPEELGATVNEAGDVIETAPQATATASAPISTLRARMAEPEPEPEPESLDYETWAERNADADEAGSNSDDDALISPAQSSWLVKFAGTKGVKYADLLRMVEHLFGTRILASLTVAQAAEVRGHLEEQPDVAPVGGAR